MFYLNGEYVKEAHISVLDLAVLRGFGVFDYLRTYEGRPFHLWDHLLRFKYSAEQLGLSLPSLEEIEAIIETLLQRNPLKESSIKLLLTGGVSTDQFTPQNRSSIIIFNYPLNAFPAECFTQGIKVITTRLARSLPTIKSTQYTPAIVAFQQGKAQLPMETLYLNSKNELLEGTTSNFFAFKNDTLYTCCSDKVLIGITREVVLKLAATHFPIETRAIAYEEISQLDEAFLTSSNREIMPIVQIDSGKIGNGQLGARTQFLMKLFQAYTQASSWQPLTISRYQSAEAKSMAIS
jgi:branched-chain amino acid aminotransferase